MAEQRGGKSRGIGLQVSVYKGKKKNEKQNTYYSING